MRRIVSLIACAMLVACGNADQPILNAGKNLVSGLGKAEQPARKITGDQYREAAAKQDVSTLKNDVLLVEVFERDAAVTMVPSNSYDVYRTWVGNDGITLTTKNGMIIETRGLGFDLMASDVDEPLARVLGSGSGGTATRVQTYLDGENQEFNRSFLCEYEPAGSGSIIETCLSTNLTVKNQYWISNQAGIWRAKQWVGDENGTIQIELLTR